jgi:5-methylcytosine-specific restriction endonuclease McrA
MSVSEAVPPKIRRAVIERDNHCCRICGQWVDVLGLHHIVYRSQGGLDVAENLVVVGWTPGHNCHLTVAHGTHARRFRELLLACTEPQNLGVTALALARWARTPPGPAPE